MTIDFRRQLQILINQKGISISKLARLTDIHQDTIYKYIRGESEMTTANLQKILNYLQKLPSKNKEQKHGHISPNGNFRNIH